jgi:hypothetical protein
MTRSILYAAFPGVAVLVLAGTVPGKAQAWHRRVCLAAPPVVVAAPPPVVTTYYPPPPGVVVRAGPVAVSVGGPVAVPARPRIVVSTPRVFVGVGLR